MRQTACVQAALGVEVRRAKLGSVPVKHKSFLLLSTEGQEEKVVPRTLLILSKVSISFLHLRGKKKGKRGETAYKKHGRQELLKENRKKKVFQTVLLPRRCSGGQLHPTLHAMRGAAEPPHVA